MPTESLVELTDIPESDPGATCPVLYANEHRVLVAYNLSSRMIEENVAESGVLVFEGVRSHLFGPPNDEALQGHRLSKSGLQSYSFYEVKHSAWIADLCAQNRAHRLHRDSLYANDRHFICTFHDSTLEVVARAYKASVEPGEPIDCINRRLTDKQKWS